MMSNVAIKVNNLTKVYKLYDKPIDRLKESLHPLKKKYHKEFYALNDVSFEIKKGETVGIIGKNGAGKSTLLKIITGVLTPSSGHVHVNGRIASLLELGAGFNPEYTGVENIYLQGTLMGYTKEEMESKIQAILDFADIGDFVYQPVKSYSSGMFARLAFAVAINVEPDILIVDEVLSVGDMDFQTKCFNKLAQLMDKKITILFVSHDGLAIKRITKKALWIANGCIQAFSNSLEVFNSYEKSLSEYNNKNLFTIKSLEECDIKQELIKDFTWGEKKVRIGNGDFLISSVRINNLKQSEYSLIDLTTGNDVYIDISIIQNNVNVEYINCSIVIFDHNGVYCSGMATSYDEMKINNKIRRIKCVLKNLLLLPGRYSFSISLWDQFIQVPFDLHERMYDFNVTTETIKDEGIFHQKHQWEII